MGCKSDTSAILHPISGNLVSCLVKFTVIAPSLEHKQKLQETFRQRTPSSVKLSACCSGQEVNEFIILSVTNLVACHLVVSLYLVLHHYLTPTCISVHHYLHLLISCPLSRSSSISVHVSFCPSLSQSSYLSVHHYLNLGLFLSIIISIFLVFCPSLSQSSSLSVYHSLNFPLFLTTVVSVFLYVSHL